MVKKSFIIAGPTASGKSDFAHRLAQRMGGTIINADSVQIYKGIENIAASPLIDDLGNVPYKLFSIKEVGEQIAVAEYLDLAKKEYDAAEVPIFVGGSGYYINVIINGMSPIPEVSEENRIRARQMVLEAPDAARKLTDFEFRDPQRMSRALEVFLETGRPLSEWQQLPRRGAIKPTPIKVLVMPDRELLAERIRARLDVMLDNGGLDEVRKYIDFPDRAIGIEEIGKFLRGEITKEEAVENWSVRTIQYAKRQRTWFRNQFDEDIFIPRVPRNEDLDLIMDYKS